MRAGMHKVIQKMLLACVHSTADLNLIIEALVEEADAEAQVLAVFFLLPKQLHLAVVAQRGPLRLETFLHLAAMWVHSTAYCLGICLYKGNDDGDGSDNDECKQSLL